MQTSRIEGLNIEAVQRLAAEMAASAQMGDVYLLYGDLGAGKTTFCKAFISYFGVREHEISSPTFNILHVYEQDKCTLYHYDLYRVQDSTELVELGIHDSVENGVTLIEWPEVALNLLPADRVTHIRIKSDGDLRNIIIEC